MYSQFVFISPIRLIDQSAEFVAACIGCLENGIVPLLSALPGLTADIVSDLRVREQVNVGQEDAAKPTRRSFIDNQQQCARDKPTCCLELLIASSTFFVTCSCDS